MKRFLQERGLYLDAYDVLFGLVPGLAGYAAFVAWADVIVRALRGEDTSENWRTFVGSAGYIGSRAMISSANARSNVALHDSVTEMRQLLREAAKDAEERDSRLRDLLREVAADAQAREQHAAQRDQRLYRVTFAMAVLAGLTLLSAIVTLVVTIVS